MKFYLLGTLQVVGVDGRVIPPFPRQIQSLLAILLMHADRTVSSGRLIDRLWNGEPPPRAAAALHVYISQLRKILTAAGGRGRLVTRNPGYCISVRPGELDVEVFRAALSHAGNLQRNGHPEAAARLWGDALDLWRGPALENLRENVSISGYARWLEELRTECATALVDARLALGEKANTISLLRDLVRQQPLHEEYHLQLMDVLHRSGRRAEALEVYRQMCGTLAVELGVGPGRSVRELHHRILRDDAPAPIRPPLPAVCGPA